MKIHLLTLFIFAIASLAFGQNARIANPSQRPDAVSLQPCEVPGAGQTNKETVLCGTYDVFENRALKSGRRIALKIVVFPATGRNKAADPLFYIPGGPGSSATEDAPFIAQDLIRIREFRDLVFVDQRGTGGSNPLKCDFFNPADLQSYLGDWNPLEQVRRCRERLEAKADLRFYVTSIAADDLDEVRRALGYKRINILGVSYGTRVTQEYLKRHDASVRAVVLHGVSPSDQSMPSDFPQHTQSALDGILDECAADDACRAAFPNLRAEEKSVLETLLRGSIEVEVKASTGSDKTVRVKFSRDLAGEAVRYMLYQPSSASRVPLFLHLAAQGNYAPLAEAAIFYRRRIVAAGSNGMYLSVTCAEDLPRIKAGEGERNSENTFLGDYRLRQQREACAFWTRGEVPKDYAAQVRSNAPALILTGERDPVTPRVYGDRAAKYLPNSLHLIVPSGGHGFNGLEGTDCISRLVFDFVNRGNAKGLDTSCVAGISRQGFVLKLTEPKKPS